MTRKPTKQELLEAVHKTISDVIAPDLKVLFCGINPGLYSGATGHHFARPGNRFWKTLYSAGFSQNLLAPHEQDELLKNGYGITNICERTTARADELTTEEIKAGGENLRAKVLQYKPKFLAVLGITTYRIAFDQPKAVLGLQTEKIGATRVWVLPNPSGLNAHYQANQLAELFIRLRETVEK